MNKTIKDFKIYLDEIEKLSKPLKKEQKDELNIILSSMLTLLISLKKSSNLGCIKYSWSKDY